MGKDRRTLPMKELMSSSKKSVTVETEHMPNFITKKPAFSCPISPYILWHHGLQFSECPITSMERDMIECSRCIYKGDSKVKTKSNRKNKKRRKSNPKVEKKSLEPIPKIGKTYRSE